MNEKAPLPDAELFRQAVAGATKLSPSGRIENKPAPRRPSPHHASTVTTALADNLSDHGAEHEVLTEFLRNGLNRMTLRKLRRAPIQDRLDLHGLDRDGARRLLLEFLHHSAQHGLRHVCIIHGKGWNTEGGEGVLKPLTRHWLTQCPQVLAFCEPPSAEGGGGAVKVLLKAS